MAREAAVRQHDPRDAATATLIARETRFEGLLAGSSPVRLEGSLKGTVQLAAPLDVAEGATLEGEVHATVVRVGGTLTGNVNASARVELLASASVRGDITTPALHVVEGAKLEGRVVMRVERDAALADASGAPGNANNS
ncbi:MAG: polymer-forming cytoskeletal protein [Thermoanaerobaculales bacterium]